MSGLLLWCLETIRLLPWLAWLPPLEHKRDYKGPPSSSKKDFCSKFGKICFSFQIFHCLKILFGNFYEITISGDAGLKRNWSSGFLRFSNSASHFYASLFSIFSYFLLVFLLFPPLFLFPFFLFFLQFPFLSSFIFLHLFPHLHLFLVCFSFAFLSFLFSWCPHACVTMIAKFQKFNSCILIKYSRKCCIGPKYWQRPSATKEVKG